MLAWLAVCVTAGQFGVRSRVATGGFLEAGACATCHREIAESYARTGMARSFGTLRPDNTFPELTGGAFHHKPSDEFFTVSTRDAKPYLKRHQIGFDGSIVNVFEAQIDYWFGSGLHARSYISRKKSGELIELPVTWYAQKAGHWAMSPGYDRSDHSGFTRRITYKCMFCHNSYPEMPKEDAAWEGGTLFPDRLGEGIDCQRCHGPGQDHVDAIRQGLSSERVRNAIVNPARLSADRQIEVCMQCHLETTSLKLPASVPRYERAIFSYRPGEPLQNSVLHFERAPGSALEDRFEFVSAAHRLRNSRCFRASQGTLTCTSCHNPHEPSNTLKAANRYIEVCQSCHRTVLRKLIAGRRHPVGSDCTSCHMPKLRPSDAINVRATDHLIRKAPAPDPPDPTAEKHDGNTPPYRGTVFLYYPSRIEKTPDRELYLAIAQVKHDANLEEGLRQLEAAILRHAPTNAEFYFELADAYRRTGRLEKAITYYEEACSRAPTNWRYAYRVGTTLSEAGHQDRAMKSLQQALSSAPKETSVLEAISDVLSRQGRLREAVSALQAALNIDPESASTLSRLGARLLQLADPTGAENAWREAVRLRPEAATMHLNLANLLASRGSFQEAEYHFRAAIRIDASFAEAYLAYAMALASHEELNRAKEQFEAALRLNPRLSVAHSNLGTALLRLGDRAGAVRHYRQALALKPDSAATHYNLGVVLVGDGDGAAAEHHLGQAIKYDPDHFEAHLKLGQILSARGESALAAPHLRKAAESPDARVREAALSAKK